MQSIPETAQPFFQEYDIEDIDIEKNGELVIERLLSFGNREEVRWLFNYYGQARVRGWLSEAGVRRLPRRRYRLWCVILSVAETSREPKPIWPH